jgi:hypothetical protein
MNAGTMPIPVIAASHLAEPDTPIYFKDVAVVVNSGGPPDKAAHMSVMSRYGLVPAAPK